MEHKYRLGKTRFTTKKAKNLYILEMVIRDMEYVLKYPNDKITSKELLKLAKKDILKVMNSIKKEA